MKIPPHIAAYTIQLPKNRQRCPISGLSRSALNLLILPCKGNGFRPPIKSVVVKQPGAIRGIRLIIVESLIAYLKSLEGDDSRRRDETTGHAENPKLS